MPITQSAKKALRQSFKRRKNNLYYKDKMKKLEKEIVSLLGQKKFSEAKKLLPQFYKIVDKAAKKVIAKNKADRKKSRITAQIIALEKQKG